jgi:ribonuclease H / adenosylcobalamin/alpha-ribazole phosphatase
MRRRRWRREASPITHLYLVRHGQSFSNVERRYCGRPPGPPLTARGRLQAAEAATILMASTPSPTLVVSSPLLRALETAQALAALLGASVAVHPDLREVGFGAWEGLDRDALTRIPEYRDYKRDSENHPPPGGERMSEIRARMIECLDDVARTHAGEAIAAFSHYDPMIAFYRHATAGESAAAPTLSIPNAAILCFEHDGERWRYAGAERRAALAGADERQEATY